MSTAIMWFRQDLRLLDNKALLEACQQHDKLILLYIGPQNDTLKMGSAQKWWLHYSLEALALDLKAHGQSLILRQGQPSQILHELINPHEVTHVYWNRLYEPCHIERDTKIKADLKANGVEVQTFNGSLLIEPWQIAPKSSTYFKVFTPYWKQCLNQMSVKPFEHIQTWPKPIHVASDNLIEWNLLPKHPNWAKPLEGRWTPGEKGALKAFEDFLQNKVQDYSLSRDFPSINATSRLSPHLHFGEISPMTIWRHTKIYLETGNKPASALEHFLRELGWREFSYHLLFHFKNLPHQNFRAEFDAFPWIKDEAKLKAWQQGQTGYPIVDAGMRELWQTGYMHNRVRMIVASFLIKNLLIDWRVGADWFWDTLLDADLANNSASWQWVAGSGADAAPYFRIFNPILQGEKFDPDGVYVKTWVKELARVEKKYIHKPWLSPRLPLTLGKDYPYPIVDHQAARNKALEAYAGLRNKEPSPQPSPAKRERES